MPVKKKQSKTPKPKLKPILEGCVVASGGDLGDEKWKSTHVERWVTLWGGRYTADIDKDVTHVLANMALYRDARNARMRRVKQMRNVHVVTTDWLEDSLNKKRRLREKDFSLDRLLRTENGKKRRSERAGRGVREAAEKGMNSNLHHIYSDATHFRYDITLTKEYEEETPKKNKKGKVEGNEKKEGKTGEFRQKMRLCIWESNAKPHHYIVTAEVWKKPKSKGIKNIPDPPGHFENKFSVFRRIFRKQTGIDWHDRIDRAGQSPADSWQYEPPKRGKPVGLVRSLPTGTSLFGNGSKIIVPIFSPTDNSTNKQTKVAKESATSNTAPHAAVDNAMTNVHTAKSAPAVEGTSATFPDDTSKGSGNTQATETTVEPVDKISPSLTLPPRPQAEAEATPSIEEAENPGPAPQNDSSMALMVAARKMQEEQARQAEAVVEEVSQASSDWDTSDSAPGV